MPILIGFAVILVLVIAPLLKRYRLRRANAKFQRSIEHYDEARRRRILDGADPRSLPTAEEHLYSIGRGAHVRNIERIPRPDPVVPAPAPAARGVPLLPMPGPPIHEPRPAVPPIVEEAPAARFAPSEPPPALRLVVEVSTSLSVSATPPRPHAPRPPAGRVLDGEVVPPPPSRQSPVRPDAFGRAEPGLKYRITYVTEWGEVTERRIRVKRVYSEHGEIYVEAHCYLRRAQRTFRADRISDMTDLDDDLPILDPEGHFSSFIEPEEVVSPEHELVMGKAKAGLSALVWVGRAGGDLEAETLAVLIDFVSKRARMGRGAKDFNTALAERWIADQRPTFELASGSLSRMKRGGPEWQMTYEAGQSVAACNDPEKRQKRLAKLFRP